MKRIIIRLVVALLTFSVGVSFVAVRHATVARHAQVLRVRESALRSELWRMRKLIDQYHVDVGSAPRSLSQLVKAGYLNEIPLDPVTEKKDWEEVILDLSGQFDLVGLQDVHSSSEAISSEGTPYNEW